MWGGTYTRTGASDHTIRALATTCYTTVLPKPDMRYRGNEITLDRGVVAQPAYGIC